MRTPRHTVDCCRMDAGIGSIESVQLKGRTEKGRQDFDCFGDGGAKRPFDRSAQS